MPSKSATRESIDGLKPKKMPLYCSQFLSEIVVALFVGTQLKIY